MRVIYALAATALLAFAIFEGVKHGWIATAAIVIGAIAGDLTLIGGAQPGLERGQIARRNVVPYNIAHSFAVPIVLIAISFTGMPTLWLSPGLELFLAGLGWALHIAADRALGFRFRTWDGRQRTAFTFA
ncbi:DUF4260 family protein [Leifsonia sp. H3M29-4]|uniref:DUF4260 family protein n=1 Tax=Salinibacterium metalliresistens TaxID=3031321 RepID=UPI0023DC5BA4|nr:DUF4260 family protein [Salinibacterium metalliresistens]MDF1477866.1 DUF4260 family protein [Salinibacterium metalliresistens]